MRGLKGISGGDLWRWTGEHILDAECDPELTENSTNQRMGSRQVWTAEDKEGDDDRGEKSP